MNTYEPTAWQIIELINKKVADHTSEGELLEKERGTAEISPIAGFRVSSFNLQEFLEKKIEDEDLVTIIEHISKEKPYGIVVHNKYYQRYCIGKQSMKHNEKEHPLRLSYYEVEPIFGSKYISAEDLADQHTNHETNAAKTSGKEDQSFLFAKDLEETLRKTLSVISLAEQLKKIDENGTEAAVEQLKKAYLVKL